MLYLTILILVLQTTFTTITALEVFAAALSSKYALLPRMEALLPQEVIKGGVGFDKHMYIEVHPCAESFRIQLSSRYIIHPEPIQLKECTRMDSPAAWWSEVGCVPVGPNSGGYVKKHHVDCGQPSALGNCVIFKPDPSWTKSMLKAWQHPCESDFSPPVSQWYTRWKDMTYDQCRNRRNAGAWRLAHVGCFMSSGPRTNWHKLDPSFSDALGTCFILDKVPVDESYVEVHPCDTSFNSTLSTFFSAIEVSRSLVFTLTQCKDLLGTVAWANSGPKNPECVPISSEPNKDRLLVGGERDNESGFCYKFNADKTPDPHAKDVGAPYKHVCEYKFVVGGSRWYSRLQRSMTLMDCGQQENAAAWRGGSSMGGCFVFYWDSNTQLEKVSHMGPGTCYILDKVVPLGSIYPSPWIVTMYSPGHPFLELNA